MIAQRATNIVGLEGSDVWTAGKQRKIVQAGSILCYWAVKELGGSMFSMARRLKLTVTAVSKSVARGERLVKQSNLLLVEVKKVKKCLPIHHGEVNWIELKELFLYNTDLEG